MIKGIDVSHWQGEINWYSVYSEGYKFAFIKATEGTGFTDNKFYKNWMGAKEAGIIRGAYHFFRPALDPIEQANHFVNITSTNLELPLALDVEVYDGVDKQMIVKNVSKFSHEIEYLIGKKPIIYTAAWYWDQLPRWGDANLHDLWVAYWVNVEEPRLPFDWDDWKFWQYTSRGIVRGISGNVDLNYFKGTESELREYAGLDEPIVKEFNVSKETDKIIINLT